MSAVTVAAPADDTFIAYDATGNKVGYANCNRRGTWRIEVYPHQRLTGKRREARRKLERLAVRVLSERSTP